MRVAIVLDPAYPELEELAEQMPIWAIDNVHHRAIAERWWKLRGSADATHGITIFKVTDERDAESNCLNIIGEVDLHHGVYSSGMPIATLRVIGAQASKALQEKLEAYGFVTFETTADGFVAQTELPRG